MIYKILFTCLMFLLGVFLGAVGIFVNTTMPRGETALLLAIIFGGIGAMTWFVGFLSTRTDLTPEKRKGELIMWGASGFLVAALLFYNVS